MGEVRRTHHGETKREKGVIGLFLSNVQYHDQVLPERSKIELEDHRDGESRAQMQSAHDTRRRGHHVTRHKGAMHLTVMNSISRTIGQMVQPT